MEQNYPIQSLIKNRWSPRAMTGEPITDGELMSLFEAARLAPSCSNAQPWRFIYAKQRTAHWERFFDLLVDFNKSWADKAAVLVLIVSRKLFEHNGKPAITHSFDTGAAWENLALEGSSRGLVIHGMQGFDYKKAKEVFKIPDHYQIEAMVAVGNKAPKESLSEALQQREHPSERKPLKDLVSEGNFNFL